MKLPLTFRAFTVAALAAMLIPTHPVQAALLAYEPFTNAPGAAILSAGGGLGFSGTWQTNSSSGVATNLGFGLAYTDGSSNTLITAGGAGLFQGSTSASAAMQPYRFFSFSRGTNGTDGTTTWISFLVVRQGPTGTLTGNPYGRGANVCHDLASSQKLAIGNSSGVATNTVGLIPMGASANLKSSTNTFGGVTNFVVVRVDHLSGANDSAWQFVNPSLASEPSTNAPGASSIGGFDYSFDRLRIFAGGQSSTTQPYAELIVDEYRVGETYADVTPHTNATPPAPAGPIVITNTAWSSGSIILAGSGGSAGATFFVLSSTNFAWSFTNWPAVATNSFGSAGGFYCVIPFEGGTAARFFRLLVGQPPAAPVAPTITTQPLSLTVTVGQNAAFNVVAAGTAPLYYQWYYNTNTLLGGATGSTLTVSNAQMADAGTYSVVITNAQGSIPSAFAALTVNPPPVAPFLTTQPSSLVVTQGNGASFSVAAGGTAPLFCQWYFNTNTVLTGETNFTLAIAGAQTNNAGVYSAVITNVAGSTNSLGATLTVLVPPYIASQPQSLSVTASNNATFSVGAGGTAPLRYQWYFNTNTPLANATNSSLAIVSAQTTNAGSYSVVVINSLGTVTSAIATLTVSQTLSTNGVYFVATNGSDSNPGTIDRPYLTLSKGITAVGNGGQMYIRGGTYALSSKLSLTKTTATNYIRIWAYPGESVVVDSTGNTSDGISISGKWYYLKGLTVMNAGHNGINISGHSNIVEFCTVHDNGNTGLHITGGQSATTYPSYNLILNCDAYLNYDPPIGGNADGFSAKWDLGLGNVFSGCRAWWNSDDGWDLWMGNAAVTITNCWAFWQGTNYWNSSSFDGNGNGFKLGGSYVGAPHRTVRCLAFANQAHGIDQNNNIAGQTVDNCTSWANYSRNVNLNHGTNTTPHVVRNNLSFDGVSGDSFTSGTLATNNSWQVISPAPTASDVQSVDTSLMAGPRQADGSLPDLPFMRPVLNGRLIDKGVNLGEPYLGVAPDLGAYEVQ